MSVDPTYFADVADALKISDPSLVEKDYYAVELLRLISKVTPNDHTLIFAGGTCLAKTHVETFRMSEDIDVKAIPSESMKEQSLGKRRACRKEIRIELEKLVKSSSDFSLSEEPRIRDEYRHQHYKLTYPSRYKPISALRPNLQLEITEGRLFQETESHAIESLLLKTAGHGGPTVKIACIGVETTAAEKFVSLLRRTAAFSRDSSRKDDPTLIRHVYDLHLILKSGVDWDLVIQIFGRVVNQDIEHFGNQHPQFREDHKQELTLGLDILKDDPAFEERFNQFIGPLVYHPDPPSWQAAVDSLVEIHSRLL